jgi:hypothetical protein
LSCSDGANTSISNCFVVAKPLLPVFAACALSCNGIALIGAIDWQRRRLVAGDDSGFGFGLSGFGKKCY